MLVSSPAGSSPNIHMRPVAQRGPSSLVSNSVTSFQTAPLAADSVPASALNSSEESVASQNTVNGLRTKQPMGTTTAAVASENLPKSAARVNGSSPLAVTNATSGSPVASNGAHFSPLSTSPKTLMYTPPSPPPSASPIDEKGFNLDSDAALPPASSSKEYPPRANSASPKIPSNLPPPQFTSVITEEPVEADSLLPLKPTALQVPDHNSTANSNAVTTTPTKKAKPPRASTSSALDTSLARKPSLEATAASITSTLSSGSGPTIIASRAPRALDDSAPGIESRTSLGAQDLLHPSTAGTPYGRPARRNTTGSAAARGGAHGRSGRKDQPQASAMAPASTIGFASSSYAVEDASGIPLDPDILKEAEQIRAERRAKAQQEAEVAMTSPGGKSKQLSIDADKPIKGHIIGEDHVNYVLMYNMLTGIRVAVSRCQAKIKHPLSDEDYSARHKYTFDIIGNELTPSAKYDFKFKDYAPFVFRELREDYFHLDPADYLLSLTAKYILSELGSPGKSGSFFYFSRDYRFIIKTIHYAEHKFLRSILKDYHHHVKTNPHTLLSRFYGLHRVKLPRGRKIHFVIMNNLFPPHRDIHETYDLKGSTVGREYPEAKSSPGAVLKDLNWINRGRQFELGPEKRALLTEQIRRDTEFLKKIGVMDYSLLAGIHNIKRGNRDNLRSNTLKVFSPSVPTRRATYLNAQRAEVGAVRRAMRESDPKALGSTTTADLPEADPEDNRRYIFYQDEGGYRATDEANANLPTIYYLGIIDILTPWTLFKRAENIWKGFKADRHKISPVPSGEYGDRFMSFLGAVMRGGEGGTRFKDE